MLLKIDSLVHTTWTFAPGRGQFGDGLSRNPGDRDVVRDASEAKLGAPKTLGDLFKLVSNSTLDGTELIDDCDKYPQARVGVSVSQEVISSDRTDDPCGQLHDGSSTRLHLGSSKEDNPIDQCFPNTP